MDSKFYVTLMGFTLLKRLQKSQKVCVSSQNKPSGIFEADNIVKSSSVKTFLTSKMDL